MNNPRLPPEDEFELDPRRRLGIKTSSEDDGVPLSKWKIIKDRLAIAGAILAFVMLMFMMVADSIENFQCSPWEFVTFKCNRFDAKFKPWGQYEKEREEVAK
jgi:hypothetical protein